MLAQCNATKEELLASGNHNVLDMCRACLQQGHQNMIANHPSGASTSSSISKKIDEMASRLEKQGTQILLILETIEKNQLRKEGKKSSREKIFHTNSKSSSSSSSNSNSKEPVVINRGNRSFSDLSNQTIVTNCELSRKRANSSISDGHLENINKKKRLDDFKHENVLLRLSRQQQQQQLLLSQHNGQQLVPIQQEQPLQHEELQEQRQQQGNNSIDSLSKVVSDVESSR